VYFAPWNWVPTLGGQNENDWATGPRKKFNDIFSLDTIHERDRRTDRQTDKQTDTATAKTTLYV